MTMMTPLSALPCPGRTGPSRTGATRGSGRYEQHEIRPESLCGTWWKPVVVLAATHSVAHSGGAAIVDQQSSYGADADELREEKSPRAGPRDRVDNKTSNVGEAG
jgi:hypothetical protein